MGKEQSCNVSRRTVLFLSSSCVGLMSNDCLSEDKGRVASEDCLQLRDTLSTLPEDHNSDHNLYQATTSKDMLAMKKEVEDHVSNTAIAHVSTASQSEIKITHPDPVGLSLVKDKSLDTPLCRDVFQAQIQNTLFSMLNMIQLKLENRVVMSQSKNPFQEASTEAHKDILDLGALVKRQLHIVENCFLVRWPYDHTPSLSCCAQLMETVRQLEKLFNERIPSKIGKSEVVSYQKLCEDLEKSRNDLKYHVMKMNEETTPSIVPVSEGNTCWKGPYVSSNAFDDVGEIPGGLWAHHVEKTEERFQELNVKLKKQEEKLEMVEKKLKKQKEKLDTTQEIHRDTERSHGSEPIITKSVYNGCIARTNEWIDVDCMLPELMQHGVINDVEDVYWATEGSPNQKKKFLYKRLCGRKDGFQLLYRCLRESQSRNLGHKDVADMLEEKARERRLLADTDSMFPVACYFLLFISVSSICKVLCKEFLTSLLILLFRGEIL